MFVAFIIKFNYMKNILFSFTIVLLFAGCAKNAITGRKQLHLVSESQLQSMAQQEYRSFLSSNKVVSKSGNRDAEMVNRVGMRIAGAIKNYYGAQSSVLDGYNWEFNLVDNKEANAWCMPGGKVVVYTGLLPITQNETALAIVMGHEITHALAQHGSERMSQGLLQQLGGTALDVALSSKPQETRNIFLTAYGAGTTIGAILPFSRKQESEADKYGLYFAAMAGYNPQEAIPFWQRMSKAATGARPPEFLSDHPADEKRIEQLREVMPEAMKYYNKSKK